MWERRRRQRKGRGPRKRNRKMMMVDRIYRVLIVNRVCMDPSVYGRFVKL